MASYMSSTRSVSLEPEASIDLSLLVAGAPGTGNQANYNLKSIWHWLEAAVQLMREAIVV
jgi:hypothetical protein